MDDEYDTRIPVQADNVDGLSASQVVEKICSLETSEKNFEDNLKQLMAGIGGRHEPFLALRPTREFMFGMTTPFDEYTISGDFESSLNLARLHRGFYEVSLTLFSMAVGNLALTRSRGGFQQEILRSVINISTPPEEKRKEGWSLPLVGRRGEKQ